MSAGILNLTNSGNGSGLTVSSPGGNGVNVPSAGTGVKVSSAGTGVYVENATGTGMFVDSASDTGVRVVSAFQNVAAAHLADLPVTQVDETAPYVSMPGEAGTVPSLAIVLKRD